MKEGDKNNMKMLEKWSGSLIVMVNIIFSIMYLAFFEIHFKETIFYFGKKIFSST